MSSSRSSVASGTGNGSGSQGRAPPTAASYPPAAAPAPALGPAPSPAATTAYLVHTETSSLHDLRLQVSLEPSSSDGNSRSSTKQPLRPLFFRERELSDDGAEIIDHIVDASTAHVPWSIHRPARGWYLRLRSPALPKGTALPLRPPRTEERTRGDEDGRGSSPAAEPGGSSSSSPSSSAPAARTPLLISLPLTLHLAALKHACETIDDALARAPSSSGNVPAHSRAPSSSMGAATGPSRIQRPHGRTFSGAHKKDDNVPDEDGGDGDGPGAAGEDSFASSSSSAALHRSTLAPRIITDDGFAASAEHQQQQQQQQHGGVRDAGATAVSTGRAASASGSGSGHTRRRSGGSGSHRIEVRKVSNEPRQTLLRERVDEEDEEREEPGETGGKAQVQPHSGLRIQTRELLGPERDAGRLGPGNSTGALGRDVLGAAGAGAAGAARTPSYSADRPYSPTEPSSFGHPLGEGEAEATGQGSRDNTREDPRRRQNGASAAPTSSTSSSVAASTDGPNGVPASAPGSGTADVGRGARPLIGGRTAPEMCHFVLLDGVDAASYEARWPFLPPAARRRRAEVHSRLSTTSTASTVTSASAALGPGGRGNGVRSPPASATTASSASSVLESTRRRWATWAWSKLPPTLRPGALPLDTAHDFSLHWTNPPAQLCADPLRASSIEVLRFRDLEGWSIFAAWSAQRRGRLELQEDAVRALGLDRGFWIAVALAYLDFLEGRDSYHAACEG